MQTSLRPLLYALAMVLCTSCSTFGNLNLFSEAEETQLGIQAYAEETGKHPQITSGPQFAMLQRVGQRIAAASGKDYEWEFKLLRADEVPNAFCLPGGKVAVYTGILPLTQTEDGLAAVIGHEVAHATLRHGGKRMTQGTLMQAAMAAIGAGMSLTEMSDEARQGAMAALGLGSQVGVLLPFSRDHETEADEVGIRYAIRAGYDPYAAVHLWERMAELGSGSPEWLSTHPHSEGRARNLEAKIPQIQAEERAPQ